MDELFHLLETQIQRLIERCRQLEHDNLDLAQKQIELIHLKDSFSVKNKIAISQIENMISHLKSIESP